MEISEEGIILETDHTGCLVKRASPDLIQEEWQPPLHMTIEAYRRGLGKALRNVYVRGSVPLGRARKYISDIDTFGIVEGDEQHIDLDWAESHNREISRHFPFVRSVEILVFPLTLVPLKSLSLAAVVKTQSVCIYGHDFSDRLPDFKPGIQMISHGWDLPGDLLLAKRRIQGLTDSNSIQQACVWAMKRIVRSGFELVMEDEGCYSRDLYTCYHAFAKRHPEKSEPMMTALDLALNPINDSDRIFDVFDKLSDWLHERICIKYGAQRIEQLLPSTKRFSGIFDSVS